jgi:hypothetical protein
MASGEPIVADHAQSAFAAWITGNPHPRAAYFVWVVQPSAVEDATPRTFALASKAPCRKAPGGWKCGIKNPAMCEIPSEAFAFEPTLTSAAVRFRCDGSRHAVRWTGTGPYYLSDPILGTGDSLYASTGPTRNARSSGNAVGRRLSVRDSAGAALYEDASVQITPSAAAAQMRSVLRANGLKP